MPKRETVAAFIAAVEGGDHVGAIERFYHEDASMQENTAEPRRGRDVLVAHEKKALASVANMHTMPARAVVVDGDHVAINWIFENDGQGRQGPPPRRDRAAGMARRKDCARAVLLRSCVFQGLRSRRCNPFTSRFR